MNHSSRLRPLLTSMRDTARTQLWPVPAAGTLLAVLAGVALPVVDSAVDGTFPPWASAVLFGGDPGAARTLLNAISTSLITVTSLTFSLTVVTLQLASSQFSPRLLRTFTSDVFVQSTLAIFLATFTYAMTLLRAVRGPDGESSFVPRISVTVAFILAITSVLALVLFLAHLVRKIRVETMLRDVHDNASATIVTSTNALHDAQSMPPLPTPPPTALRLTPPRSGFITGIDEAALLSAAQRAGACVVIDRHPGNSIVEGVPIGLAWAYSDAISADQYARLQRDVGAAIGVGYERTAAQDVGFGLRQLADVAIKALSPGINDPTTAVHALSHISALLCQLATRDLGPIVLRDDHNQVRVVLHRPAFSALLDEAVTQPRRYGAADPQVLGRLFTLLEELAWHVDDYRPILAQLERLQNTVARSEFDTIERVEFDQAAARIFRVTAHRRRKPSETGAIQFLSPSPEIVTLDPRLDCDGIVSPEVMRDVRSGRHST